MNKKVIAIFMILMIFLQTFMPIVNAASELDKTNVNENSENLIEEKDIDIKEKINNTDEIIDNETNEEENNNSVTEDLNNEIADDTEIKNEDTIENSDNSEDIKNTDEEKSAEDTEIIDQTSEVENNNKDTENSDGEKIIEDTETINEISEIEDNDEFEVQSDENYGISVASSSGYGANAGNEGEFSNIFYNTGIGELTIQSSIRLNNSYTVNHNLRIDSSSQSGANSLQLSSGCRIVVPNGCVLTLDEVVIDGRSFGNNDGKSCITVQNGGVLMLTGHSIIDGGTGNWGINVESGGQLLVESGQVCYCDRGIVLQGSSYCDLASATAVQWWGNTGKSVDIIHNSVGIYCGGAYRGNLVVNHTSQSDDKMNFEYNTWGIYSEGHSGSITVQHARMAFNGWAIYTYGNMNINNVNGAFNAKGIVNDGGTVNFNGGGFYSNSSDLKENGVYNNSGTVNMRGGSVYNSNVGIWNAGTINMSAGVVGENTNGIENYGTINFSGGTIRNGTIGLSNYSGTCTMSGGQITGYAWGVKNLGNFNISNGTINNNSVYGIVNQKSDTITGQLYMTGGNVTGNTNYDIYHEKSDTDGAGAIYGGLRIERNDTVSSKIILAAYNNYIYVGTNTPTINNITLGDVHLERNVIRAANTTNASTMVNKITVNNKGSFYCKANGAGHSGYVALWTNYTVTTYHKTTSGATLGSSSKEYAYKDNYTTSAESFEDYVLSKTPSNASGTVTGNVSVTYTYELDTNVAIVNYKDLLSGVQSAVYWYNANANSFGGTGTSFNDGKVFEDYGFYKVTVTNGVGLTKTITFELNKDSV